MPLLLPDLDDRKFTDLLEEARGLIPAYAPDWTNHNESDPGITLVELFAFLTEMLTYRVNRITAANTLAFLRLMNGPDWSWTPSPTEPLVEQIAEQVRNAVLELRELNRAITVEDYERLALEADPQVRRVRCLARRDLEAEVAGAQAVEKPGHVSIIIVPGGGMINPQPGAELLEKVKIYLELRRLLATHLHIVGPRYFTFEVRLTVVLKPDALEENFLFALANVLPSDLNSSSFTDKLREIFVTNGLAPSPSITVKILAPDEEWLIVDAQTQVRYGVRLESGVLNVYESVAMTAAIKALLHYFDPLTGGEDGRGWPFGRNVFVSELYQILDSLPGVDYVRRTLDQNNLEMDELTVDASEVKRLQHDKFSYLTAVKIAPEELVDVKKMEFHLTLLSNHK